MTAPRFAWVFALLAAMTLVATGFGARFGVRDCRHGFELACLEKLAHA